MWLSFVIPLYNCEKYIGTCLDSILRQGLNGSEYEVVVVNDGSTDRGKEVVERYNLEHSNIRLVNQENGGVASARNRGIEEARGTYIHFMDADDRLLPDGMKTLRDCYLNTGEPQPDMLVFGAHTVDRHYETMAWEHIRPHRKIYQGSFFDYGSQKGFGWSVCTRIISRHFLLEHNIRFCPYAIGEDVLFMMDVFTVRNAEITATNLNIYRYCVREGSALTRVDKRYVEQVFNNYIGLFNAVKQKERSSIYRKEIFSQEIAKFQRKAFIRLVSSSFSRQETERMLGEAKACGFYPLKETSAGLEKFINVCTAHPGLTYLFSILFRHIFPYIKPWVRRN